jgi:hypothetical protein
MNCEVIWSKLQEGKITKWLKGGSTDKKKTFSTWVGCSRKVIELNIVHEPGENG